MQIKRKFSEHKIQIPRELLPENRALTNITLHISIMPHYLLNFMISPFWLLNIEADRYTLNQVESAFRYLLPKVKVFDKNSVSEKEKGRYEYVLRCAYDMCCKAFLSSKARPPRVPSHIGLWSHKLGWGTAPLNSDGDGKLIFNPVKANRNHGSYDYGKFCQAFSVLVGWGTSST
jgi:hypothetical protein